MNPILQLSPTHTATLNAQTLQPQNFQTSLTTASGYTERRTAEISEQAKSTIDYLSNNWASC